MEINMSLYTILITLVFLTSCNNTNDNESSEALKSDDIIETHQSTKDFAKKICTVLDNLEPLDLAGSLQKKLYCRVDGKNSTVYFKDWDSQEFLVSTIDTKHVKTLYDAEIFRRNSLYPKTTVLKELKLLASDLDLLEKICRSEGKKQCQTNAIALILRLRHKSTSWIEINHYQGIAQCISNTGDCLKEIDAVKEKTILVEKRRTRPPISKDEPYECNKVPLPDDCLPIIPDEKPNRIKDNWTPNEMIQLCVTETKKCIIAGNRKFLIPPSLHKKFDEIVFPGSIPETAHEQLEKNSIEVIKVNQDEYDEISQNIRTFERKIDFWNSTEKYAECVHNFSCWTAVGLSFTAAFSSIRLLYSGIATAACIVSMTPCLAEFQRANLRAKIYEEQDKLRKLEEQKRQKEMNDKAKKIIKKRDEEFPPKKRRSVAVKRYVGVGGDNDVGSLPEICISIRDCDKKGENCRIVKISCD